MCKGMYDFLDDFCRTENRQENRMCKHGLTNSLTLELGHLLSWRNVLKTEHYSINIHHPIISIQADLDNSKSKRI